MHHIGHPIFISVVREDGLPDDRRTCLDVLNGDPRAAIGTLGVTLDVFASRQTGYQAAIAKREAFREEADELSQLFDAQVSERTFNAAFAPLKAAKVEEAKAAKAKEKAEFEAKIAARRAGAAI